MPLDTLLDVQVKLGSIQQLFFSPLLCNLLIDLLFFTQGELLRFNVLWGRFLGEGERGGEYHTQCTPLIGMGTHCLKFVRFGTLPSVREDKLKTLPPLVCCLVTESLAWSEIHSLISQCRK